VNSKLTLNIGIRADYFFVPQRNGTGMEYYDETRGKMVICGVASNPMDCGIFNQYKLKWAPRFGAAYRITDRTVIRAGFGISSDPINIFAFNNRRLNFPFIVGQILLPPNSLSYATTLRKGIPVLTAPDLSTGSVDVPGTAGLFDFDRANYKRGYIQTYNFTIEQRLKEGWTASVGYVGSKQVDPWLSLEENWSLIGTGTAGLRLNNAINNNRVASTPLLGVMGGNNYNSLQSYNSSYFFVNSKNVCQQATGGTCTPGGTGCRVTVTRTHYVPKELGTELGSDPCYGFGNSTPMSGHILNGNFYWGSSENADTLALGTPATATLYSTSTCQPAQPVA